MSKLFHWKVTPTRAFNEFLYEFLRFFLISENSLKFANFFAEVTNSRSMVYAVAIARFKPNGPEKDPPSDLHHSCSILYELYELHGWGRGPELYGT